jgi:hypothetical protein
MSNKFRINTPDAPEPRKPKVGKPGKIGDGKIGVYDAKLRLRGVVGPLATATTAARFHGQLGSTIRTVAGRKAWVAPTSGRNSAAQRQMVKLRASLRADRGSVSSRDK